MTSPPVARRPVTDVIRDVTGLYIAGLQKGYLDDRSTAVAVLAQLRRGAGKVPQDVPELWGVTGTEALFADGEVPPSEHERAEAAYFLAVTLYALHQQSHPSQGMHRNGVALGAAVRRLMPAGDMNEAIRRKFVRVGTADTLDALADRLREIVSLLRRESVPLDYALLATQLYQAQFPGGMRRVRQSWGRGFHTHRPAASGDPDRSDADTPEMDV